MPPVKRKQGPALREMNDLQLLAHLISMVGTDLSSARELAHVLLDANEDLGRVLCLPADRLLSFPGLDESAASFLLLISALIDRYRKAGTEPGCARMETPEELVRFVAPHFAGQSAERLCVFCLGPSFEFVTASLIAHGDGATVSCPVSRVLELAMNHQTHSVVLAHNHPDGIAAFSKSDLLATGIMAYALATVGIELADHLLLAGGELLSLRELYTAGKLPPLPCSLPPSWLAAPLPFRGMRLGPGPGGGGRPTA